MAKRLPLLRGRITAEQKYLSTRGGGGPRNLPSLNVKLHHERLIKQIDKISEEISARENRDELANREIITVQPFDGYKLKEKPLGDVRQDAVVIGENRESGSVVLDVKDPGLSYLRDKIDDFADDSKVNVKTVGEEPNQVTVEKRKNQNAVAPIDGIRLAKLSDIGGPRFKNYNFTPDRKTWLEITCRGGYHRLPKHSYESEMQINHQLKNINATQKLEKFEGPEQISFFALLTYSELEMLYRRTDCIYEVEVAAQPFRDMAIYETTRTKDLTGITIEPPPKEAPAIVLLDTGIATEHPLLKPVILSATAASEIVGSPEDMQGHGTKMAGVATYSDIGSIIEQRNAKLTHWLQSTKIVAVPHKGLSSGENYEKWPILTSNAITSAENEDRVDRNRVYVMAVTGSMDGVPDKSFGQTLWSQSIDQLSYNDGQGRLIIVSAGNAQDEKLNAILEQYPDLNLTERIHEPAQATNALTVGALTMKTVLPNDKLYEDSKVVAKRAGGISPNTSAGPVGKGWAIKPDILMEGGNIAVNGPLVDRSVPTLCTLTTSRRHNENRPLDYISMTSEAAARAAHAAATIWRVEPSFQPESVRALLVHSAKWSEVMVEQFESRRDRVRVCGYGATELDVACECTRSRATIVVEDEMKNTVYERQIQGESQKELENEETQMEFVRRMKLFKLPLPLDYTNNNDAQVELRVTLSYFAEVTHRYGKVHQGLSLYWDMQGPQETMSQFFERINMDKRPKNKSGKRVRTSKSKSFEWDIGIESRSRGTVQSDRWKGTMSELSGDKLIAIMPVYGWWDRHKKLKERGVKFSLVVSVIGPGVYSSIEPQISGAIESLIES